MEINNAGQVTYPQEATKFFPDGCPEGNNAGGDCGWCQVYYGWWCPGCCSGEIMDGHDGQFNYCEDCGFTLYDAETLQLIQEVQKEQAQCKAVLGYVPTLAEAVEKGLVKP